jgi:DNA-binding NarL/FixJ family response regulator
MARYTPGSQSRAVMAQKEVIAARLLGQGLTTSQVAVQLRCSPNFVRRVRSSLDGHEAVDRRAGSLGRSA